MGCHQWIEQCSYCGFEEMNISSDGFFYLEAFCPICGYEKWTEEKIPDDQNVQAAKRTLSGMSNEEKQKAIDLYYEDGLSFVKRVKQ
jgi:uncharacterized Zn finger protein (UPF0148 family)